MSKTNGPGASNRARRAQALYRKAADMERHAAQLRAEADKLANQEAHSRGMVDLRRDHARQARRWRQDRRQAEQSWQERQADRRRNRPTLDRFDADPID